MQKVMQKTLIALALTAISAQASALTTGDIAFTGFNADKDYWSVVALTDLAAHTQIFFSDNEWNGTAFNDANEHTLLWNTGASAIGAGTVVLFTEIDNTGTPDTITASAGTLGLAGSGGTNLGLSASGDTLYAYLGAATAPTAFLTAIGSESGTANIANAGLTVGVNAVKIATGADFGEYTGVRTGQASFAAYATLVNDGANWNVYTDGDRSALVPSTVPFEVTAVPEAETYAMMLAGLGLVGWMAARRSKA